MNLERSAGGVPPAVVWDEPPIRKALAEHDLTTVFRALNRRGFSQRRIGALTGQSQSEISEICSGRRVMAYDVLRRIADGLGVPRGYMGLGRYDTAPDPTEDLSTGAGTAEAEEVRRALAHAAEVTMGVARPETADWCRAGRPEPTPVPRDLRQHDVANVEHMTSLLRAMDYRFGGGACRDAVAAQAVFARRLLTVHGDDALRSRLRLAAADLLNLAGWTSFDVGLFTAARRSFGLALELAAECRNASLVANVLYRHGRLHLHQGYLEQALRFFQLGQLAAQDAEEPGTVAMLHANEAWAHALMGNERKALHSLGRAEDEFGRPYDGPPPDWVSFFSAADLHALSGIVRGLLPSPAHTGPAIAHLTTSIAARGDTMTRSAVFELTALATIRLDADDVAAGVADGHLAVDLAEQVRSVRTVHRLAPLQAAARRHPGDEEAIRLVRRITTLCGR